MLFGLKAYSYGGTINENSEKDVSKMEKRKNREILIEFNADTSSSLNWNFQPQQRVIKVIFIK